MEISFIINAPWKKEIMQRQLSKAGIVWANDTRVIDWEIRQGTYSVEFGHRSNPRHLTCSSDDYIARHRSVYVFDVQDKRYISSYLNATVNEEQIEEIIKIVKSENWCRLEEKYENFRRN